MTELRINTILFKTETDYDEAAEIMWDIYNVSVGTEYNAVVELVKMTRPDDWMQFIEASTPSTRKTPKRKPRRRSRAQWEKAISEL